MRPKIEYASVVFTGVVTTLKHKLKVIQNICLRLMLGARNTTPIRSMEVEANIAQLDSRISRQDLLLAKLFCKLCYWPANNETTILLQIESGSDVVGVLNSFRRRAAFALLNIGNWDALLDLCVLIVELLYHCHLGLIWESIWIVICN